MNLELVQAQKAINNAREALRDGNRSAARRWAEQAAKLAPDLEDPWLILAAVASPKASVAFIERALQINPDSPRARKGMQWALKRLQEVPPVQRIEPRNPEETTRQVQAVRRSAPPKKLSQRRIVYPVLLLALGCAILALAAWTASTSPVLASLLAGVTQPVEAQHPKVWAQVEIAKPDQAETEPAPALVEVQPTQPPPTSTLLPTQEPTVAPPTPTSEPEPTSIPEATSTPGVLVMEIVEVTQFRMDRLVTAIR